MAAAPPGKCDGHFNQFLQIYDFKVVCKVCSKPTSDITYSLISLQHDCDSSVLLAKKKDCEVKWRHIAPVPVYPKPEKYFQCRYYREGKGCAEHSNRCTYARSTEEAGVWNLLKQGGFTYTELITWLKLKQGLPPRQRNHGTHSTVKEKIHQKFPGQFMELCAVCLHSTPKSASTKSSTSLHCSRHKHVWKAALVYRPLNGDKVVEIRPKPEKTVRSWSFCNHVKNGRQCQHGAQACWFVHSEVEMAVWTAESENDFNRSVLLTRPHKQQHRPAAYPSQTQQYPCTACAQTFTSRGCFMNHCNTLQHSTRVNELNSKPVEWKFRDPPPTNQAYKLCERACSCTLGDACADAHSEAELQEWRRRDKVLRKNITAAEEQGLLSYQSNLLREYRDSTNANLIMAEVVAGVTVHCDKELMAFGQMEDMPMKWHFKIQSERQLVEVALLKQEPGASFSLGEISPMPCTYASGKQFRKADMTYDITVSFEALNPGLYEQWLVLDFDMRPVLLQKLKVRVGQPSSVDIAEPHVNPGTSSESCERWHRGNRVIIPCTGINRTEDQEELLKEYKPPQISFLYKPANSNQTPLSHENYKERMHHFLYDEELAQDQIISRMNIRGPVTLSTILDDPRYGAKFALPGEMFCAIEVPYSLTPDTTEGQLLKRGVQSALIGPISSAQSQSSKVYEAIILRDATSENKMHLKLPEACCSELKLQPGKPCNVEIQFRLDRLRFCEMHKAVDRLPDTYHVLPNIKNFHSFVSKKQYPASLNSKQQAAMAIIAANEGTQKNAPFLIYGPFGTGKTFMLATAAKELSLQPQNKVLICSHTNSSADLYVTRHFHDYVQSGHLEAKPLRIKAEEKKYTTTDPVTLKYCHLSNDGIFSLPDRGTIDRHRIVITTTSMAQHLHDLKLPSGYFTHILIDEASQMLECEALMPLGLAGPNTRVVLAGDHMQMGPKLFSVEDHQRSNHTLLNRLFHFYQSQASDAALKHRIIFNENYRSTKEIVDFVATHFYVGKIDVIKAVGNVPAHPNSHVLEFHHVRGECHLDTTSMSWCNGEEITKVAEIIQNVLSTWPCTWGKQDQSSICVLSDGCQVSLIRQELRKRNLRGVTVENIANVQGKQFRIIVITAVQTRDRLLLSDSHYLEFFNDPCVLNTAMTRAQSKVVVVGDAAALCNFGKCSRIWKDYIEHCISKQSVHPATLTEDVLAQEAIEICKFLKDSRVDNSDSESSTSEIPDIDDPILRELLDEDKDVCVDVTSEGLLDIIQDEQRVHDLGQHKDLRLKQHNSTQHHLSNYKRCTLFMDRFDSGYAIPIDDTSLRIDIKGRANIGHAFPGDQVDVEITDADCCPQTGKVARVLHSELASKKFVCTIENFDFSVMTPINKCITKIYTPCWKDKPNHIAVRRSLTDYKPERFVKINEESKRNSLFVVQVLTWRERFKYPLGIVVQVLPKVTSLDAGLGVLDIEYQLHSVPPPEFLESDMRADLKNRKDYREITTFTIDPAHSNDLDDAISVRDLGSDYEIGVHIADVASLVPKDSQIDKYAQQNGTTFYPPGPVREPAYMFPDSLTSDFFSLLPEAERNAISLMVKIDKETNCIKEREFTLSVIRSDRKLSYDEAENILHISNTDNQRFDTLEDCVAIACHFSEIHRKARKRDDWCYKMADEDDVIGRRRAHMMVEDLMIMYNNAVAEWLLNIDNMGSCTPLRCQDKPDAKRLCRLKERFSALIPLSIHLTCWTEHIDSAAATQDKAEEEEDSQHHQGSSHQMAERDMAHHDQQVMSSEAFSVLTSVMRCLESAVTSHDIPRILDLVTTSDIYPQLQPLLIELRRSTQRASNLCSNSTQLSRVGHYDLQLDCYTWASSPIRRYIDVIVQRVMHSALKNTAVEYTEQDISQCCLSFSQKSDHQSKYDKTAQSLKLAAKLNDQSARKVAFVIDASPGGKNLSVTLPLNRKSIPDSIQICYRDMQLADQPQHDEHSNSVVLQWLKRVYSFTNEHIHIDLQQEGPSPLVTTVPVDMWQDMLSSVKQGNHTSMCQSLQDISFQVKQQGGSNRCQSKNRLQPSKTNPNPDHYFGLSLAVKPGDTLQVQLGTDTVRGMLVPVIQMLIVHDRFEICLEHSKNPIVCFSKYALHSSRPTYPTYMEYQKIWKPLCEMEAASSAVAENESIVIEDVELTWQNKDSHLTGSFQLPLEKKKQWAINCDLRHVFLCIRLRDLDYSVHLGYSSAQKEAENTNLLEVPYLTWVAHGITTMVTGEEEEEKDYVEIHFRINHMPMDFPNGKISRSSKFTVELIPKMLPDVRKENAIENLRKANQLVKNIALGKRIISGPIAKKKMPTRFEIIDHPSVSFPMLNNSQIKAIREALTNPFTVIQGPPGTGKTVVGVHLVYWFFQLNQSIPRLSIDNDTPMRMCILYCGPSNKSVDVVAVHLLKLREVLRPLRVYGDQMEMLEFPYPGSNLRLSRHYVREEKPNADLRSITLHHLIRGPENPHSSEILSFDARIKRQEDLSDEEIESYKKLLYDAKRHELQKHDIVLCTCTSASNPLIKLHFQQIIIDECAMATEPEAFIPLVAHKPEQIILLGDHKQLQPIVNCDLVSRLGMSKSLFERYMEKALMLDIQYRMHEGICKFPSMEFYNDQLKTDTTVQRTSVLLNKSSYPTPIIFGHVNGQEIGLVVSTQHGNENSKANVKEAEQTVHVASLLIKQGGVKAEDIAILTPYNAQVARINEIMTREGVRGVTVITIAKSQGSEWRYVIISTVRSCPKDDIDPYPTKAWLIKRLGFVMDPNQMNVGITRAQHGLCIIGNRELLQCSSLWKRLLRHYREHNCVLDSAMDIQVRNMQRKACKPRKRHC